MTKLTDFELDILKIVESGEWKNDAISNERKEENLPTIIKDKNNKSIKKNILLLHGLGDNKIPHWQSWLSSELSIDYNVYFPHLNDPYFPTKKKWMTQVKSILSEFKPDIVICYSMACTLWFHLCEDGEIDDNINRLLLVAPPNNNFNIDGLDSLKYLYPLEYHENLLNTIKSFYPAPFPKKLFAKEALLITSTNDPYLNSKDAQILSKNLNVEMKIIENAGHFNQYTNYGKWPWVFNWITKNFD